MKKHNKGFTLVELLVVLVIIAILGAVATPIYLYNTKRAKASEAIAMMALIRQAERDFKSNHDLYFDVASNAIQNDVPQNAPSAAGVVAVADSGATPPRTGLKVDAGVAQYFSNSAYVVEAGTGITAAGRSGKFTGPDAVDFTIFVNGSTTAAANGAVNTACVAASTGNCAAKQADAAQYQLEMDNSGRTFVSYDGGGTWAAY